MCEKCIAPKYLIMPFYDNEFYLYTWTWTKIRPKYIHCRLVSLSELNISANDLEELPPSVGLLRHLRTLYADENFLEEIPVEVQL